ncbi:hypothetical protein FWP56_22710 [Vibrio vulnificus]|nr:hypothetical protein [Vibrio parahaemolyticus]EGQ9976298.1 hypothetical protein [Vibrio vulnificus]EKF9281331.1 hypothetical protein [Vibrio cholerae]EGR0257511.1 hypothetical protein [Vibrio parahaemolyticus]ODW29391.1 hypothetical protein BBL82_11070 [Vibrio parahaemolyticus]
MLNHPKSVVYDCSLFPWLVSFVFLGKLASVGAVFRTIILWRWKFSELPHSIFQQARGYGGWLNQQFDLRFFSFICQSSKSDFQNYESFQFFWFSAFVCELKSS